MTEPFVFLCSDLTHAHAQSLIHWLRDGAVRRHLTDTERTADDLARAVERLPLPLLVSLLHRDGRLYIANDGREVPVGFLRLVVRRDETELVLAIGNPSNWGRRLGYSVLREGLKIAFFELRSPRVVAKIHPDNKRSLRVFARAGFRLAQATPTLHRYTMTLEEYIMTMKNQNDGSCNIHITLVDKERLRDLIEQKRFEMPTDGKSLQALEREIDRATVVESQTIAPDVVTMRSRALLTINGEPREVALVYPQEADLTGRRLSVLSPIGTAILGYREGDRIEWDIPSGRAVVHIERLLYQPEAAGEYHL